MKCEIRSINSMGVKLAGFALWPSPRMGQWPHGGCFASVAWFWKRKRIHRPLKRMTSLLTKAGALYLLYIGCRGIFSKSTAANTTYSQSRDTLSPKNAFFQGFLTNVLNPKCALFYISLFSQFISPTTPLEIKIGYGLLNWCIVLCWFLLLSWIITSKKIQERLLRFRTAIDRIMGSALVYLGIKLLFI